MITPDVLARVPDPELDGRIAEALSSDNAKSSDAARLLAEVKEAASAAELAAADARERALDPRLAPDDVRLARREMEDAAFTRDRLTEAASRLGERVADLKALEAGRRLQAEHERVSAERDRLAEAMERMADPIAQIARTASSIAICDREIGRLNATSTSRLGYIRPVRSGAAPAITALFGDAVVWDAFIAVAGLQAPPVVSGEASAKDKLDVKRPLAEWLERAG